MAYFLENLLPNAEYGEEEKKKEGEKRALILEIMT
jgi:hypothetical protein